MIVNVKVDNKMYSVVIRDLDQRPIIAEVEGAVYEIWPDEDTPQTTNTDPVHLFPGKLPEKPSAQEFTKSSQVSIIDIRAPLPGTITVINISPGDKVNVGQELMRLEAMKMSNVIRSSKSGTVTKIHVTAGQQVKHGETLVSFSE